MPGPLKVLACYLMWAFLVLYWPLFGAMDPLAVLSFRIVFSMLFCLIVILITGEGPAILALMKDKRQMLFFYFWQASSLLPTGAATLSPS